MGMRLEEAARWAGRRHALLGPAAAEARLHLRRDAAGGSWLSLAWAAHPPSGGVQAAGAAGYADGGAAAPPADEQATWRTYRPFDEHGCAWRDEEELDPQVRPPPLTAAASPSLSVPGSFQRRPPPATADAAAARAGRDLDPRRAHGLRPRRAAPLHSAD